MIGMVITTAAAQVAHNSGRRVTTHAIGRAGIHNALLAGIDSIEQAKGHTWGFNFGGYNHAQYLVSLVQGYHVMVTPLQMARAFCAYANGGRLVQPTLVKGVLDADDPDLLAVGADQPHLRNTDAVVDPGLADVPLLRVSSKTAGERERLPDASAREPRNGPAAPANTRVRH